MKIESFDHALPYSFTRQFQGKDPGDLLELERSKSLLENMLRWEDDGGRIIELNHVTLDQERKKPNA